MTLADQIGRFVTMALSAPSMGVGGGSVTEERAQDRWKEQVRAEGYRLRQMALPASPEAVRIIDAVLAEV